MNHLWQSEVEEIPLWNIVLDLSLIALSLSSAILITTNVSPFQGGFFCDDATIRYPYMSSTVSLGMLYAVGTTIPVLTVAALELWQRGRGRASGRRVLVGGCLPLPAWSVRLVRRVLLYGLGQGCMELLLMTAKYAVGRPRPHFLAACRPEQPLPPDACVGGALRCTSPNHFAVLQARLSFPSGHSSLAFYAAVFTVLYVERRVRWPERAIVVKTTYEVAVVLLAWFTALSRVSDYKHHWEDVLVGSLLGITAAYFVVHYLLCLSPDDSEDGGEGDGGGGGGGGGDGGGGGGEWVPVATRVLSVNGIPTAEKT